MPRGKIKREPERIVKREHWEDDEYTYTKYYFMRGNDPSGTSTCRHPKHPKEDPEVVKQDFARMLTEEWLRVQREKKAKAAAAAAANCG